jgi:hypothetical protein
LPDKRTCSKTALLQFSGAVENGGVFSLSFLADAGDALRILCTNVAAKRGKKKLKCSEL